LCSLFSKVSLICPKEILLSSKGLRWLSQFSYSFCPQSKTSLLHMKTHQVESTARCHGFKEISYFILCTKLVNRCISAPLPNQAKDTVVVGISSPSFLH
jgi:hypothetical protein